MASTPSAACLSVPSSAYATAPVFFSQSPLCVNYSPYPGTPKIVNLLRFKSKDDVFRIKSSEIARNLRSLAVRCEASSSGRISTAGLTEMAWQMVAKENRHRMVKREHLMKTILEQKNRLTRLLFSETGVADTRLLEETDKYIQRHQPKSTCAFGRRNVMALILSGFLLSRGDVHDIAIAQSIGFREYIDTYDGYNFKYPQNWIQVRGAGADVFFRDPLVLDENVSVNISSPSSSSYKSVEDLGTPEEAGQKVLKQYLVEFMSTRLGVRREPRILSTSSRVASDGKVYYEVEANIKSYATNNELAVMPQDRVVNLEWDRRYLSVLGVENKRLYELRLQTPEKSFAEEENDLRQVINSFRVSTVVA